LCQPSWAEVQWQVTGVSSQSLPVTTALGKTVAHGKTPSPTKPKPALVTAASLLQQTLARTALNQSHGSAVQRMQLELTRGRGVRTGQKIKIEIDTITGSVCGSRGRSDYEQPEKQFGASKQFDAAEQFDETLPLPMASQLADSTAGRAKARA
jgi:hypothetical protein